MDRSPRELPEKLRENQYENLCLVDVCELEPPGPLETVLEAVQHYQTGQPICMRHRREPCSLFSILKNQEFSYKVFERRDDFFEILIWRSDDQVAFKILQAAGFQL